MYEADDFSQYLLNNSEKAQQQNVPVIFCQICSAQRPQSSMFTISQKCDQTHKFCITCLQKKVVESINKNEDVYCPIDFCPCILSETSRFFSKMSNNVHNKYVIWKASKQYMERNKSFRESRASLDGNYFNYAPVIKKENQQYIPVSYEQKKEDNVEPKIQKKKGKRKNRKQNKAQEQNKQKYLDMSIVERRKDKKEKNRKEMKQIKEQQIQIPLRRAEVAAPIPFHAPKAEPQPEIAYTCCNRIVKCFYVAFMLPVLFLLMGLLILSIFVIYLFMLASMVGSLILIVAAAYFLLTWIVAENKLSKDENLKYTYFFTFGWLMSLGFAKFFTKYLNYINYLVIANSWLWWINRVIYIWAYPYPSPILYLGPKEPKP